MTVDKTKNINSKENNPADYKICGLFFAIFLFFLKIHIDKTQNLCYILDKYQFLKQQL